MIFMPAALGLGHLYQANSSCSSYRLYISIYLRIVFQKFVNSSNFGESLIEGPLIGTGYRKICLDFTITLRKDGEQLHLMHPITKVQQVIRTQ